MSRRRFREARVLAGVAFCAGMAGVAAAQPIAPPVRSTGALFGENRSGDLTGNGLSLTFNLGGGYDQNVDPVDALGNPIPGESLSGYLGTADTTLRYRRGTDVRFLEATGIAYMQSASIAATTLYGGDGDFRFSAPIGGRVGVTGAASASYSPTMLFNAFGPVGDEVGGGVPNVVPQGITEQQWRSFEARGGLYRNWTPRQRLDLSVGAARRTQVSGGPRLDNTQQLAQVNHAWNLREYTGLDFTYGFSDNDQDDINDVTQQVVTNTVSMGLRQSKPLARARMLALILTGGASHVRSRFTTIDYEFWAPVVAGALRWDVSRGWSIRGDLRRDVTVLEGISPEPFVNNVVSLATVGTVARRIQLGFTGSYSSGAAQLTDTGEFSNATGIAQVQVALSRRAAWYTSYSVYRYELFDVQLVQPGFPSEYSLQSVRTGVTFWFPLSGRF